MDMTINRPKIYDDITKKCLEIFDDGQSSFRRLAA